MAYLDQTVASTTLRQRLAWLLDTPFDRRYRARTDAIAALRAKSDADLAEMGLQRDDIVSHVFAKRLIH